jgi:hypothetical protein
MLSSDFAAPLQLKQKKDKISNEMTFKFAPTLHIFQRHIIDNVILTN